MRRKCSRCTAFSHNGDRCKLQASCNLGCDKFCWIHSATHVVGESCKDIVAELQQLVRVAPTLTAAELSSKLNGIKTKLDQQNVQTQDLQKLLETVVVTE